jgi:hypothetical protein
MRLCQGYHIYDYNNILDFKSNNICIIFTGWCHSPKIENYEVKAEIIYNDDNTGYINFEVIINNDFKIDIIQNDVIEDENVVLIYCDENLVKIWYDKKNKKNIGQSYDIPIVKLQINFKIDNNPKPLPMSNDYGSDILYYQKVKRTFIFDKNIYDLFNPFIKKMFRYNNYINKNNYFDLPRWCDVLNIVFKNEKDEIYKYHELF